MLSTLTRAAPARQRWKQHLSERTAIRPGRSGANVEQPSACASCLTAIQIPSIIFPKSSAQPGEPEESG
jgi:hypothetical protein